MITRRTQIAIAVLHLAAYSGLILILPRPLLRLLYAAADDITAHVVGAAARCWVDDPTPDEKAIPA